MTIEEKKKVLKRYGEIDDRIEQLRRDKEKSRLYDTYHNTDFEQEVKSGKVKGSVVEIAVEKRLEDWDRLIKIELESLFELRIKIENAISALENDTERKLLRLLYLGEIDEFGDRTRLGFSELSERLGYSERQIYRIYKKALEKLNDICQ